MTRALGNMERGTMMGGDGGAPGAPGGTPALVKGAQGDFKKYGEIVDNKKCIIEFTAGSIFHKILVGDTAKESNKFVPAATHPPCQRGDPSNPQLPRAHFFAVQINDMHKKSRVGIGIAPVKAAENGLNKTLQNSSIRYYAEGVLAKSRKFVSKDLHRAGPGHRVLVVIDWQREKVVFFLGSPARDMGHVGSRALQYTHICTNALTQEMLVQGIVPVVVLTQVPDCLEFVQEDDTLVQRLLLERYMANAAQLVPVEMVKDTADKETNTDDPLQEEKGDDTASKAKAQHEDIVDAQQELDLLCARLEREARGRLAETQQAVELCKARTKMDTAFVLQGAQQFADSYVQRVLLELDVYCERQAATLARLCGDRSEERAGGLGRGGRGSSSGGGTGTRGVRAVAKASVVSAQPAKRPKVSDPQKAKLTQETLRSLVRQEVTKHKLMLENLDTIAYQPERKAYALAEELACLQAKPELSMPDLSAASPATIKAMDMETYLRRHRPNSSSLGSQ